MDARHRGYEAKIDFTSRPAENVAKRHHNDTGKREYGHMGRKGLPVMGLWACVRPHSTPSFHGAEVEYTSGNL